MRQFRFAFLIMCPDHNPEEHHALIEVKRCKSIVIGVRDLDDACRCAKNLLKDNLVDKIELCGAFKEDGAKAVSGAVEKKIPVGYVTEL